MNPSAMSGNGLPRTKSRPIWPEIGRNLMEIDGWSSFDVPAGISSLLRHRCSDLPYVLDGSDREKLDLLRRLSATDFLSAEWMPIPENFGVIGPDGERLRYAQLYVLSDEYSKSVLVGPLLEKLAASVPEQLQEVEGEYRRFKLEMPEAPLTVLTVVVEHPDGRLVPMLNNQGASA